MSIPSYPQPSRFPSSVGLSEVRPFRDRWASSQALWDEWSVCREVVEDAAPRLGDTPDQDALAFLTDEWERAHIRKLFALDVFADFITLDDFDALVEALLWAEVAFDESSAHPQQSAERVDEELAKFTFLLSGPSIEREERLLEGARRGAAALQFQEDADEDEISADDLALWVADLITNVRDALILAKIATPVPKEFEDRFMPIGRLIRALRNWVRAAAQELPREPVTSVAPAPSATERITAEREQDDGRRGRHAEVLARSIGDNRATHTSTKWEELYRTEQGTYLLQTKWLDTEGNTVCEPARELPPTDAKAWLDTTNLPVPPELDDTPAQRSKKERADGATKIKKLAKGKKPSLERAQLIVGAIRTAGRPLAGKEIKTKLGLDSAGGLSHHLSWMAADGNQIVKLPGKRGYWLAGVPIPDVA